MGCCAGAATVLLLGVVAVMPAAAAESSTGQIKCGNAPAGARDLHVQIAGTVKSFTVTPPPDAGTATNGAQAGVAWSATPAGAVSFDVARTGGGRWNGKWWWTFNGDPNTHAAPQNPTGTFSAVYPGSSDANDPDFGPFGNLFGTNPDTLPLSIDNINVTVINDENAYYGPNYLTAPGTTFSLPGQTLAPGATKVLFGAVPVSGTQWLRVSATYNGTPLTFAYNIPEPGTLALLAIGGLMAIARRGARRDRR